MPKKSVQQIDERRLAHAQRVAKSRLIRRFAPLELQGQAPAQAAPGTGAHRFNTIMPQGPRSEVVAPKMRSMDIFERALAHADAHAQPPVDPKKLARTVRKHAKRAAHRPLRHHAATVVAASCAAIVLTGFIAYQNKANLLLHYASAEAGFHASLPSYRPSGFAVGKFNYRPGQISVAFHNDASNQAFTLTQKASNWDSQTLLDSVVASSNKTYQTLQSKGQTIYVYNNNDATWASNGIVYQLSGQGNLSTSQLLDIATSM